jgi:hypothetical protein
MVNEGKRRTKWYPNDNLSGVYGLPQARTYNPYYVQKYIFSPHGGGVGSGCTQANFFKRIFEFSFVFFCKHPQCTLNRDKCNLHETNKFMNILAKKSKMKEFILLI